MTKVQEAMEILKALGLPSQQINERTAFCLLALVNLTEGQKWDQASNPLLGITRIIAFTSEAYDKSYAPNSREGFRKFSIQQLVQAGLVLLNPDSPEGPTNSSNNAYQIEPNTLKLLKTFGTRSWKKSLAAFLQSVPTLVAMHAKEREMLQLPVQIAAGMQIKLSPGSHSQLIKSIVEDFAPRFAPNSKLVYVGDTGDKWGYFDEILLSELGLALDNHGKMPDVILFLPDKNWLLLIESVTSHGPVDGKRHLELTA
jgi:hypothetical protein